MCCFDLVCVCVGGLVGSPNKSKRSPIIPEVKKCFFCVCVIPLTFISKSKVGGREADYTLEKV